MKYEIREEEFKIEFVENFLVLVTNSSAFELIYIKTQLDKLSDFAN